MLNTRLHSLSKFKRRYIR